MELDLELKKLALKLENSPGNFFIAGKAGTGKSSLIKYFAETTQKNLAVLAPTGVAAVNIDGQTIHSFFGLPLTFVEKEAIHPSRQKELFRHLQVLVIDEISMVRADIFDAIDYSLRINTGEKDLPFGGVQMILAGDLYQLPPVVETSLREVFKEKYQTPYFFSAKAFSENRVSFEYLELEKIFRQSDEEFLKMLHEVRIGKVSQETFKKFNERAVLEGEPSDSFIVLTSKNDAANKINQKRLSEIEAEEKIYPAEISGQFDEKSFPTELDLKLKPGAKIMFLKNDPKNRWVNGTLGYVVEAEEDFITAEVAGLTVQIEKAVWQKIKYVFNKETQRIEEEIIGTFTQYPLRLAWAVTIHKSQGMTFDNAVIDFGAGAFVHGQTYVALSRCRSLDGIYLRRPLRQTDLIFDPRIEEFYQSFDKGN